MLGTIFRLLGSFLVFVFSLLSFVSSPERSLDPAVFCFAFFFPHRPNVGGVSTLVLC